MSDRVPIEIVCPNNHNQTIKYSKPEFEAVLRSGTLLFHCNTCDTQWSPSANQLAEIRKQLKEETA